MKRIIKYFGILMLTVIVLVVGFKNIMSIMDPTPSALSNKKFTEVVNYVNGSFVLNDAYMGEYDDVPADELYIMVHKMSHHVVISEEKWGYVDLTEGNINKAILITLGSKEIQGSRMGNQVLRQLTKWKQGDFSTSDELHNLIWEHHNGTVGIATGTRTFTPDWDFNESDYN